MVISLPRPLSPQRSREWIDPLGSSVTGSVSHAAAAVRRLQEQGCRSQPWASRGTRSEEKTTPHQATSSDSSPVWDMLASGKLRHDGMAASRPLLWLTGSRSASDARSSRWLTGPGAIHTARVTARRCERRLIFGTAPAWSDWGPETLTGLALSVL